MRFSVSCGLFASLCWGTYIVLSKVATSPRHYGLASSTSALLMGVGAAVTLAVYFVLTRGSFQGCTFRACVMGILPGVVWALGMAAVLFAVSKGALVSKLVLIYNTNTFVAVFLGAVVLREVPHGGELIRVIAGAVLVTVGISLASWG